MIEGVLLLGHGSRVPEANQVVRRLAAEVQRRGAYGLVEVAYLANASPTLEEGVAALAAAGAERVVVVPVFLSQGIHVVEDIPAELQCLRDSYQGRVELVAAGHLGDDPRLAEIIIERIREVR